jgi:signal peptidase I
MKKILYSVWEIVEVFLVALIAVAAIKYFLIQPFIVNGASMEPNFYDGDYLLVDELSYRFRDVARGDVVVFKAPQSEDSYYIKRVIGLPGEHVEIIDNQVTVYNDAHPEGNMLQEQYLSNGISHTWSGNISVVLKDGQYFVMGDNRLNSLDSRYWGPLEGDKIVGVVKVRLWPISSLSIFSIPEYITQ